VNLFYEAVFRDGAFTSNDPSVRASKGLKCERLDQLTTDILLGVK
jgi:hypothetical protein